MSIVKIIGKTILLLICSIIRTLSVLLVGVSVLLEKLNEYTEILCDKLRDAAETGVFKKKTTENDIPL